MSIENESYETVGEISSDGQFLQLTHWRMLRKILKKFVGKELVITIAVLKAKRSLAQNRYLWGVVVKYVRHWLHETQGIWFKPDYVYTWIRIKLLEEEPVLVVIDGIEMISLTGKRFSQMSTAEFAIAIDTIRDKMLDRGVEIPEPSKDKNKHNFVHEFLDDN